ncbi:hypothetical protein MNNICLKF_00177 [Synechococcus sp. CBW1107]|nr:hypothetical protein MNNICLKF_00177 [Synechococcus sp. CBW1107]
MQPARADADQFPALPGAVNPEQLESLQVLALALVPVALIWWAWLRLLR